MLKPYIDIFAEAKRVPLIPGHYAIISGGVLAAHGLRETSDLDILAGYRQLGVGYTLGWQNVEPDAADESFWISGRNVKLRRGMSRLLPNLHVSRHYCPHTEEIIARADIIRGFAFITLRDLHDFKKALWFAHRREKDVQDVQLLERYFGLLKQTRRARELETPGVS